MYHTIKSAESIDCLLEYWRLKYGLTDQDLDRYRYYLNEDDDDWLDM